MCCDVDACSSRTVLQFIVLISLSINDILIFMYYTIGCIWTYVKIDGSSYCMHGPVVKSQYCCDRFHRFGHAHPSTSVMHVV